MTSLSVRAASFALPRPSRSTWTAVEAREVRLVRWVAPDGVVGYGEAAPLPGTSVESMADVDAALRGLVAAGAIDSNAVSAAPASVRFALELAAHDAASRRRGVPLAVALGADPAAEARPDLLAESVLEAGSLVDRCLATGRGLKIKLGPDDLVDLPVLTRVRRLLPAGLPLTLDANRRLSFDAARRVVDALDRTAGAWLEEPVDTASIADFVAGLPTGVRVAIDESLGVLSVEARQALVRLGVGRYVLRPTTLGFDASSALAAEARTLGIDARIAHAYEGPVATRGLHALALAWGDGAPGLGHVPPELPGVACTAPLSDDWVTVLAGVGLGVSWEAP